MTGRSSARGVEAVSTPDYSLIFVASSWPNLADSPEFVSARASVLSQWSVVAQATDAAQLHPPDVGRRGLGPRRLPGGDGRALGHLLFKVLR